MLEASPARRSPVRNRLALLAVVLSVSACSGPKSRLLNDNDVQIHVTCPNNGVLIDVKPFLATAAAGEPMNWRIVASANVASVNINEVGAGTFPFTNALPIVVTASAPGQASVRKGGWVPGSHA